MAQITIYVPDRVADQLKRAARKAKKSLSAYLVERALGRAAAPGWPDGFFDLMGSCAGSLERPGDPPPEDVEPLG